MGGLVGVLSTYKRWACALAALSFVTACASGGGTLTSPFYRPEPGVFYRYGNFCGAQFPAYPEGATREERIAIAIEMRPVDSIDRACQAHDLCYEAHGHDAAYCDNMFFDALGHGDARNWRGDNVQVLGCGNLATEMRVAVAYLKPRRHGDANVNIAAAPVMGSLALTRNLVSMGVFPTAAGRCMRVREYPYAQALPQFYRR